MAAFSIASLRRRVMCTRAMQAAALVQLAAHPAVNLPLPIVIALLPLPRIHRLHTVGAAFRCEVACSEVHARGSPAGWVDAARWPTLAAPMGAAAAGGSWRRQGGLENDDSPGCGAAAQQQQLQQPLSGTGAATSAAYRRVRRRSSSSNSTRVSLIRVPSDQDVVMMIPVVVTCR